VFVKFALALVLVFTKVSAFFRKSRALNLTELKQSDLSQAVSTGVLVEPVREIGKKLSLVMDENHSRGLTEGDLHLSRGYPCIRLR